MARFAVIGAGVTGLAAAWELGRAGQDVVVFEAADRVGGKVQAGPVPSLDHPLEAAADAFLARVPDAIEVCEALGIDDLVAPATRNAFVYAHGALRPLPTAQVLGLPTDLDELARTGLISDAGLARARQDLASTAPPVEGDVAIGALVRERLGDEVCDHLVQPLVGGINAGDVDVLSAAAVAPQHLACARAGGSLIEAARRMRADSDTEAPVFLAPRAGMYTLPERLAADSGAHLCLGRGVTSLNVDGGRAVVDGEAFDGVVVAVPGFAAAPLLAPVAPAAAEVLGDLDFASVVLVTLVFDARDVNRQLDGSGFVVSRTEDLPITAASWGSSKWDHWGRDDQEIFRVSLGRDGDPVDWVSLGDEELRDAAIDGLGHTMGVDARPTGVRVGRWPASFAQYRPGHLDRVATVHAAVAAAGPVAVAGASLEGVGIPACLRQGRDAARRLLGA